MCARALVLLTAVTFAGAAQSLGIPPEYTTYIGDAGTDQVVRIRADAAGNTYVAGNRTTTSTSEVFLAKLDAAGHVVSRSNFGRSGANAVADMAIDPAGNIYLAGRTSSTDFSLYHPLQSTPGPGFLVKLDPPMAHVIFATYFPAAVQAIATDAAGNSYVTGTTDSNSFPVTAGLPAGVVRSPLQGAIYSIFAAFITKVSPIGDRILFSTLLSGTVKHCGCCSSCFLSDRHTAGVAITVDPAGNTYIAGNTDTADLPVTPGVLLANGVGAFAAKVNANGRALSYLTYIGPTYYPLGGPPVNAANTASAIAVDADGSVYLAGSTYDPHFPATPGVYQTTYDGPGSSEGWSVPDGFVLKMKPDASGVDWATYLGGRGAESIASISLGGSGNVWISGTTTSPDFPNAQGWSQGADFLAALNPAGSALTYAARYPTGSVAQSLAVDSLGLLHAAGTNGIVSAIAPTDESAPRIFGVANAASGPVGGQVAPGEVISIYGPHIGPSMPVSYVPTDAGFVPTDLGGVQVTMGGHRLPLLYVSDSQINAVAPLSPGDATGATLQVAAVAATTPEFPFAWVAASPQVFQNADGTAAVNEDGTVNSPDHPARAGSIVSMWVTGAGATSAGLQDGQIATSSLAFACCAVYVFPYFESPAEIVYSGSAPGTVAGVVQINFRLTGFSPLASTASATVVVAAGGQRASPVTIYIH